MKTHFLLSLLLLTPAFSADDCPGCTLSVSPPTEQPAGGNDPDCDTTVTVDIWATGDKDGAGECILGVDLETGSTECQQKLGCTIGWSYEVTTNSAGGSCTGVSPPAVSWSYDSGTGSWGQQDQDFAPDTPVTGAASIECGSVSTITVVHDGSMVYQSATCSPCLD